MAILVFTLATVIAIILARLTFDQLFSSRLGCDMFSLTLLFITFLAIALALIICFLAQDVLGLI